jgi:putative serine protease PepD
MQRTLATVLVAVAAGGLAGGAIGAATGGDDDGGGSSSAAAATTPTSAVDAPSATAMYRRDAPGVVEITATETQQTPSTPFTPPTQQKVTSLGSGFVIDMQGDIVTNDHVVAGGSGIRVGFDGGSSYPAKVVGMDPSSDLAVVRVSAPKSALHPIAFDDSSHVQVGAPVYAIGNPFGLDRTMTAGIVSATGRDIQAPDGLTIPNAIQTDAPINHGNSGGPLLDGLGHVIGVTSQIQGGTVDANVGVGFAIPSDTARSVAQQLIAHGSAQHAWLGVRVAPGQNGVRVAKVVGDGPAAKAGLRSGSTIVAVGGTPTHSPSDLAAAVAAHKPGDRVSVKTTHGTVQVMLADAPQT